MKFCVRVDDLGWLPTESDTEPLPMKRHDTGLALAQSFHSAMGGAPYLGAVIPHVVRRDNDAQAWLASRPAGLTVALHGITHRPFKQIPDEWHRTSDEQVRDLVGEAQNLLRIHCGGKAEHFVPPFNSPLRPAHCDALWYEGIRYVWGGGTHESRIPSGWHSQPPPYAVGRVMFVPSWAPLYSATLWRFGETPRTLLDALGDLRAIPGTAVVTMHITWEATHCGEAFVGVREFVEKHGQDIISPEEYLA